METQISLRRHGMQAYMLLERELRLALKLWMVKQRMPSD